MASKRWMLGKHLRKVQIWGGVKETDGTVTWTSLGTPSNNPSNAPASGSVDYVRIGDQRMLENITGVDALGSNYELVLFDDSLSLGEILKRAGNILPSACKTYEVLLVAMHRDKLGAAGATVTYQTGGTGSTLTIVQAANTEMYVYCGTIDSFSDGITVQGRNACEVSLKRYDLGNTYQALALFDS